MNNYHLYRTNLLLGGQMKLDLIVGSTYNTLCVTDFHLTPISNNTPYTYKTDENLINNSHQDNVKAYYSSNKGHFYDECLDANYSHVWPIICDENDVIDSYSNIYDSGCKRSLHYNKYNKQFEFFCPVWLEHVDGDIEFKISIRNIGSSVVLASNSLVLSKNEYSKYHNRFVDYLNTYIENAGLKTGNDDILNIQFNKNIATISGLNASNGLFETHVIDDLIDNITSRERPVMEVNDMLMGAFVNNTTIARQLFNFNLCFNIDDIMSGSIANMLKGNEVIVSVDVYVNGNKLIKKDFYSEHECIYKDMVSTDNSSESLNVLDYLHDYECIDLIDKNKFCQSICHWSLFDNEKYIFNTYEGFSGLYKDGEGYAENEHQYGITPNTFIKKYDPAQHSTGWLNVVNIDSWNAFYEYIKKVDKHKEASNYVGESNFINNIKYSYITKDKFYLLGFNVATETLLYSIVDAFKSKEIVAGKLYIMISNNIITVMANDMNYMSYNVFFNSLSEYCKTIETVDNDTKYIKELCKTLESAIEPSLIVFNKSIKYSSATAPSKDAKEITYYKDDSSDAYNYIFRYDGKLKPMFVDKNGTLYYKDYVSNDESKKLIKSVYTNFNTDEYEPLYPSINFCAIKKLNNWNYDILPTVKVTEHDKTQVSIYGQQFEYTWFNDNRCLILNPELKFVYTNTKENGYETLETIVTNYISSYYNTTDEKLANYIKSLYSYTNDWEYVSDVNIDDYTYNISMKLK